jgi:hypothetical protein
MNGTAISIDDVASEFSFFVDLNGGWNPKEENRVRYQRRQSGQRFADQDPAYKLIRRIAKHGNLATYVPTAERSNGYHLDGLLNERYTLLQMNKFGSILTEKQYWDLLNMGEEGEKILNALLDVDTLTDVMLNAQPIKGIVQPVNLRGSQIGFAYDRTVGLNGRHPGYRHETEHVASRIDRED